MNQHAMRYVAMSQKVRDELPVGEPSDHELYAQLLAVENRLVAAEIELAAAYGEFRDLLKEADEAGAPSAERYLEVTWWDLT